MRYQTKRRTELSFAPRIAHFINGFVPVILPIT